MYAGSDTDEGPWQVKKTCRQAELVLTCLVGQTALSLLTSCVCWRNAEFYVKLCYYVFTVSVRLVYFREKKISADQFFEKRMFSPSSASSLQFSLPPLCVRALCACQRCTHGVSQQSGEMKDNLRWPDFWSPQDIPSSAVKNHHEILKNGDNYSFMYFEKHLIV